MGWRRKGDEEEDGGGGGGRGDEEEEGGMRSAGQPQEYKDLKQTTFLHHKVCEREGGSPRR